MPEIGLSIEWYRCDPCSKKQGVEVRELVRMIPKAGIVDGTMVGVEYWCCPVCYDPKFYSRSLTAKPLPRKAKKKTLRVVK